MRKIWPADENFDDLMIGHHHPGHNFCPIGGFGCFLLFPREVFTKSDEAAERITGKTSQQLTEEMIKGMMK
jgi:hypothetical protein